MVRICHVSSCFIPSCGGVETYVYNICKRLSKRGFDVRVITSSRGKLPGKYHERIDEVEVFRYPERFHIFETPILFQLLLRVLIDDYDLLHVHGMTPTLSDIAILIGKLCRRRPVLLTYHFDAETQPHGFLGKILTALYTCVARQMVKLSDGIVATSKSYVDTSPVLRGASDVIIIPCGVDLNKFTSDVFADENPKAKKHQILYVGKLYWYKGIEHLVEAMGIVLKTLTNVRLTLVGEGPQKDVLSSLVDELGLRKYIKFVGGVSDEVLLQFYRKADLLVLPSTSRREAFGIVLLEAMACGKAVIVSDIPGPNSVVENGKTGLLVPPADPAGLASAIIDLLLDDDKRKKIGTNARESVKARNDWDSLVLQYEDIYNEICRQ